MGNGWSKLKEIKTNFIRAGQEKTRSDCPGQVPVHVNFARGQVRIDLKFSGQVGK